METIQTNEDESAMETIGEKIFGKNGMKESKPESDWVWNVESLFLLIPLESIEEVSRRITSIKEVSTVLTSIKEVYRGGKWHNTVTWVEKKLEGKSFTLWMILRFNKKSFSHIGFGKHVSNTFNVSNWSIKETKNCVTPLCAMEWNEFWFIRSES